MNLTNPIAHTYLDTLLFIGGCLFMFFTPGSCLIHWQGFEMRRGERFCFAWVLGFLASSLVYFLSVRLKMSWMFPLVIFLANAVYWSLYAKKDWGGLPLLKGIGRWQLFYGVWAVSMICIYWAIAHRWAVFGPDGLKLYSDFYSDNLLGGACAAEMKHSIPPENPLYAGQRLLYQYFPYIGVTIFSKVFSMKLLPVFFFYLPIFSKLMLFLTVICVSYRSFQNQWVRLLAVAFTILLSAAGGKIGYSIGFSYFFWGFLFFCDMLKNFKMKTLFLTAVLWGTLFNSVSIMAIEVIVSVFLFTMLHWKRKTKIRAGLVWFSLALVVSAFLWTSMSFGIPRHQKGSPPALRFNNSVKDPVRHTIEDFSPRLYEFWLSQRKLMPRKVWGLISSEPNVLRYLFVSGLQIISFLAFVFQILGFGVIGLWGAIVSLKEKSFLVKSPLSFLALLGVVSIILPFVISPRESSGAVIFYNFATVSLLFFSAQFVYQNFRMPRAFVFKTVALVLFLHSLSLNALGSVVNFKSTVKYYTRTSPDLLKAYSYLKENTSPDELVFHRLTDEVVYSTRDSRENWIYTNHNYYFGILAERRSLYIHPTLAASFSKSRLPASREERLSDLNTFFKTEDFGTAENILKKYRARWVLVTKETPIHFQIDKGLARVYQSGDVIVFKYSR